VIRLSVTDLDSYLYWKESDDMELEELLKRLRGETEPTPAMLAGRAFHKMFELAEYGDELQSPIVDNWQFVFAIEGQIGLPAIRELKGEVVLATPSGPVTLVGKVDSLDGMIVHDYKLTERFEAERYTDSYQWRAYLEMFGATHFVYDVFQARYDEQRVTIYDYHRLPLNAYRGMRTDLERAVAGLAEIVSKHVPQKITEAA
jgi:hypothetical protein